jgi:hypothetical protein
MCFLHCRILLRMAQPHRQAPAPEPAQLRDDLLGFSFLPCFFELSIAAYVILHGGSFGVIAGRASYIEIGGSQTDPVENQSSLRNRRENAVSNRVNCADDEADRMVAEQKNVRCPDVIAGPGTIIMTKIYRSLA